MAPLIRLSLVVLAMTVPLGAQPDVPIALHLGPLPNPGDVSTPVPEPVADSYADLRKAHERARHEGIVLVPDAVSADAILTITFRGTVDAGTTIGTSRMHAESPTLSSTQHSMRTLRARLTVASTGEGVDFSGVSTGDNDRTRWSTQAARIYQQATAWLAANRNRVVRRPAP